MVKLSRLLRKSILIGCMFTFLVSLIGCASGPAFKKIESIPEGKSVVYFYRPANMMTSALSPSIYDNERIILNGLSNGSYWVYFVDPGKYVFSTSSKTTTGSAVTIDIKSTGEEFYIRMDILMKAFVGETKLTKVYPDQGREEITKCKFVK